MTSSVIDGPVGSTVVHDAPMSKTAYVLERLRAEIAQGLIVPGDSLRQADVAGRYGVSATPVREALRLLEADGTITYAPHRGATVTGLSSQAISDLYRLRGQIESLAVELAVERMSPEGLARIQELHRDLRKAQATADPAELSARNRELHFAIYGQGSALITSHLKQIWAMLPPRSTIWAVESQARKLVRQHDGIVKAIVAEDPVAARELMLAHIMTAERFRQRTTTR